MDHQFFALVVIISALVGVVLVLAMTHGALRRTRQSQTPATLRSNDQGSGDARSGSQQTVGAAATAPVNAADKDKSRAISDGVQSGGSTASDTTGAGSSGSDSGSM
jgi:hypothetical protein